MSRFIACQFCHVLLPDPKKLTSSHKDQNANLICHEGNNNAAATSDGVSKEIGWIEKEIGEMSIDMKMSIETKMARVAISEEKTNVSASSSDVSMAILSNSDETINVNTNDGNSKYADNDRKTQPVKVMTALPNTLRWEPIWQPDHRVLTIYSCSSVQCYHLAQTLTKQVYLQVTRDLPIPNKAKNTRWIYKSPKYGWIMTGVPSYLHYSHTHQCLKVYMTVDIHQHGKSCKAKGFVTLRDLQAWNPREDVKVLITFEKQEMDGLEDKWGVPKELIEKMGLVVVVQVTG